MKIEILYFAGCPNHISAVHRVREVLRGQGVTADLVEVEVKDAETAKTLGFPGSPTIRVNGQDIEPSAPAVSVFGLTCRTYVAGAQRVGLPPAEWIAAAISEAQRQ